MTVSKTQTLLAIHWQFIFEIEMEGMEQTYIMIKPDGVQRGIVGRIISRFEDKGFQLVGMKLLMAEDEVLAEHYGELKEKPFFPGLLEYIKSGPVVAMAWKGKGVVATARQMMGTTNPANAAPGTIRGDFGIVPGRNVIHGSDAVESGEREVGLWFNDTELVKWTPSQ